MQIATATSGRAHDTLNLQLHSDASSDAFWGLTADEAAIESMVAHRNALVQECKQPNPLLTPDFTREDASDV